MLLRCRFLILRTLAWCLGMSWSLPPYEVFQAFRPGCAIRMGYEVRQIERCNCPKCKAERGEVNGEEVPGVSGEHQP